MSWTIYFRNKYLSSAARKKINNLRLEIVLKTIKTGLSRTAKKYMEAVIIQGGEVVQMSTYEAISLMIAFGMLVIALLAYIDRNNKRK